jgi:phosphoglycolate phosphatase
MVAVGPRRSTYRRCTGTMAAMSPTAPPSSVTAVLWDIDGTLLTAGKAGVNAFLDAVADVTGTRPSGVGLDLGGRIDPDIAVTMLAAVGASESLAGAVLDRLAVVAAARRDQFAAQTSALTGIPAMVHRLAELGVRQTVVTGNIEAVGRIKLLAAGLAPPIDPDLGGFGDHGSTRAEVAAIALAKLVADGWESSLDTCWIVGDTPRDAACAKAIGVRCALVATGRHDAESLSALAADVVIEDFDRADTLLRHWIPGPG